MKTIPETRQIDSYSPPPNVDMIRLWQHFSSVAGDDKNKMIAISNWLLTGSLTVIGFIFTKEPNGRPAQTLSALGISVSLLVLYIVILYGSHERWNRRKAEIIVANDSTLQWILPPGDRPAGGVLVFGFYLGLALLSTLVQIIIALYRG